MRHRSHLSAKERLARSRLAKIVHESPILCGSLVRMQKQCGKTGCKCAFGERHQTLCLAIRTREGRKMIHIPKELEEAVCNSVETYQEMRKLLGEISESCLDSFLEQKAKRKGERS